MNLPDMFEKPGIAIDIDDTLSDTNRHFIGRLLERFGAPHHMSVDDIIAEYQFTLLVPFWQTQEIQDWLAQESMSNEAQEAIPPKQDAVETIKKINELLPVRKYITSRPSIVEEGTKRWLQKHGFPEAELITRPMSKIKIDSNAWKAAILENLYPHITGIVDDNPEIMTAFTNDYKGTVYLFGHTAVPGNPKIEVVACPTWHDVLTMISSKRGQDMV